MTNSPTTTTKQNVHTSSPSKSTTQNVMTSNPSTSTTQNVMTSNAPTTSTHNILTSNPTTSTTADTCTNSCGGVALNYQCADGQRICTHSSASDPLWPCPSCQCMDVCVIDADCIDDDGVTQLAGVCAQDNPQECPYCDTTTVDPCACPLDEPCHVGNDRGTCVPDPINQCPYCEIILCPNSCVLNTACSYTTDTAGQCVLGTDTNGCPECKACACTTGDVCYDPLQNEGVCIYDPAFVCPYCDTTTIDPTTTSATTTGCTNECEIECDEAGVFVCEPNADTGCNECVLSSQTTTTVATTAGTTNCDECVISGSTRTCSFEENGVDIWGHCETQDDGCNICVTTDATTTTDEATTTQDTTECDADYLPFCYANDRCQAGSNVAGAIGSLCKVCVAMDALDVSNIACLCDDVKTEIHGQSLGELNLRDKIVEKIVEHCWTSTDTWTCSGADGVVVEDPDTCGCCALKCDDVDANGCGLTTTSTDGNVINTQGKACRYGVGVAVSFVIAVLSWT
eukprot:156818_1